MATKRTCTVSTPAGRLERLGVQIAKLEFLQEKRLNKLGDLRLKFLWLQNEIDTLNVIKKGA